MKKTKILEALLAGALAFALFSCSSPSGGGSGSGGSNTPKNHDDEDQPISGTLTTVETWPGKDEAGEPITYYINNLYTIKQGGSLSIQEGAIVKFGPNGKITVENTGAINATKTIFTSYKDSRGRKILTAGDTDPAPGDWKQISIKGGNGKFEGCEFSYGGNGCSTLFVDQSTTKGKLRVNDCTFTYNSGSDKVAYDIKAALKYDSSVDYDSEDNCVTNSVFKNNVWALSIPADFTLDDSNTFGTSEEEKNTYNYVQINSYQIKKDDVEWAKQDVPYIYVGSNYINLYGGSSGNGKLTIKGGEDADHPNIVCFATVGIDVDKGGELDVEDFVLFRNSPESENTKFKGLYCAKDYKFQITSNTTHSVQKVLLTPSSKIKIENYEPTGSNYLDTYQYHEYHMETIKHQNFWEKNY